MTPLKIAHVAPVATSIPPVKSGSVQTMTSLLTEALVGRGHDVTLFATADSRTSARLHATYPHGYWHDDTMWPWELYEMLNVAAAVEQASRFDIIHYEASYYPLSLAFARLSSTPIVQTIHHAPSPSEVALWQRYPDAPFIAISREQAKRLAGLHVAGTVLHAIDTDRFTFRAQPDDYLLFLGRFTEGKGVLQAIDVARRAGLRLLLAGADDAYYRNQVAPRVDGRQTVYVGEADFDAKVALYGGARALLYPVQSAEPFGLVMAEAMACGTPVAALNVGAVQEVIDEGITGCLFENLDAMAQGLDRVLELDRRRVHTQALARFSVDRMAAEYEAIYRQVLDGIPRRRTAQ